MFFLIMALLVAVYQLRLVTYMVAGSYVEDALAASNLASALIDIEEYGKTHKIVIRDPYTAFTLYRDALDRNLDLDIYGYSLKEDLIKGKPELEAYTVYNVEEDRILVWEFNGSGELTGQWEGGMGTVYTPDGIPVEHTTIYSRVAFQVEGFRRDSRIDAVKQKSVDIMRYERE